MKCYAVYSYDGTWLFDLWADDPVIALRDAVAYTTDAARVEHRTSEKKVLH